jgi:hypothetical protein
MKLAAAAVTLCASVVLAMVLSPAQVQKRATPQRSLISTST